MKRNLLLFFILFSPFVFYSCKTLKPLAPDNTEVTVPKIIQPVSNVEVPVIVDLKSYFIQAENSVPVKYADSQQPCEGLRYAYTFTRTPFAITGDNNVVSLNFTGSYGFNAAYCAKCPSLLSGPHQSNAWCQPCRRNAVWVMNRQGEWKYPTSRRSM